MRKLNLRLAMVAMARWSGAAGHGAETLTDEARATMAKAATFMRSIATAGGDLWRYSSDLKVRAGENPATAPQISGNRRVHREPMRALRLSRGVEMNRAPRATCL